MFFVLVFKYNLNLSLSFSVETRLMEGLAIAQSIPMAEDEEVVVEPISRVSLVNSFLYK